MNAYEKKFKDKWKSLQSTADDYERSIKTYTKRIKKLNEDINAVKKTLELIDEPSSVAILNKAIEDKQNEIDSNVESLDKYKSWAKEAIASIKTLQDLCPHEEHSYDHSDYHNNTDYFKCKLCGRVF